MYGFKYFINGKIFELCKNVENVKGLLCYFIKWVFQLGIKW